MKLLKGIASHVAPGRLAAIVNVGDDFTHLGLHVSPDLDTVMYTLADQINTKTGWGRSDETWRFMHTLRELGGETWFNLGDRDLATHVCRTHWIREGATLSEVTTRLCRQMGIMHDVLPATDDRLRTVVETSEEALAFQHYFVREQCIPASRLFTSKRRTKHDRVPARKRGYREKTSVQ